VKRFYNRLPKFLRPVLVAGFAVMFEMRSSIVRALRFENPLPFANWGRRKVGRGMTVWYDMVDWVGGYPFEVAKPEEIFDFCKTRGFRLDKLMTCGGGLGCNQFVFTRDG
jgi:2-polyprenyl-6-hydroxyphenyl methylase/3-demethylubiquinone-9 3-methyltransferase